MGHLNDTLTKNISIGFYNIFLDRGGIYKATTDDGCTRHSTPYHVFSTRIQREVIGVKYHHMHISLLDNRI